MNRWCELTLPADPHMVGIARQTVTASAAGSGLTEEQIHDLRTCVSEAVTNAIQAHTAAGTGSPIIVRLRHEGDGVVVEVHDEGPGIVADDVGSGPVDPSGLAVEELTEGGYGLPVIAALADDVELLRREDPPGGTIVRVGFRVGAPINSP